MTIAGSDGVVPVVSFDGVGANGVTSVVYTTVGENSTGKGGDINITARSLSLTNNAQLSTSTIGQNLGQDAGNIRVNVSDSLTGSSGSLLQSIAYGSGNAGNVTIQAGDTVAFDGVGTKGIYSGVFSYLSSQTEFIGNRKGGDINIDPTRLTIANGAGVVADSQGSGRGGDLNVQADYLTLDNNASLSATATSAEGGNIALQRALLAANASQQSHICYCWH